MKGVRYSNGIDYQVEMIYFLEQATETTCMSMKMVQLSGYDKEFKNIYGFRCCIWEEICAQMKHKTNEKI